MANLLKILLLLPVEGDEDEQHHRECPERRAAVADERQRDADDRHKADGHADVDEQMHEEAAGQTVAVDARKRFAAAFGVAGDADDEEDVEQYHCKTAHEAPLFTDSAENKVRALLRHEAVGSLRALEIALAEEAAGADGDHALPHVVAHSGRVFLHAQQHLDTAALMVGQHVVEHYPGAQHHQPCRHHSQRQQPQRGTPFTGARP